jgi:hypothetical protein
MKIAPSAPVFVVTFTAAFSIIYVLAVEYNWALFTYAPATGKFGPLLTPATGGPTMYWYGWIMTAGLGAGVIAGVASLVPEAVAKRVWSGWSWVVPICVLVAFGYILRGYFMR